MGVKEFDVEFFGYIGCVFFEVEVDVVFDMLDWEELVRMSLWFVMLVVGIERDRILFLVLGEVEEVDLMVFFVERLCSIVDFDDVLG